MTEPSVIDLAARRQQPRSPNPFAEYALTQCEEAYASRDWARFDYWFRIYREARGRLPERLRSPAPPSPEINPPAVLARRMPPVGRLFYANRNVAANFLKAGAALLLLTFAAPSPAGTMSYSSSDKASVIASRILPDVAAAPIYIKLIAGHLSGDEPSAVSTVNSVFYQLAGTTELSVAEETTTLAPGDAAFIPNGARVTSKAASREPSLYLEFLLSPDRYSEARTPAAANAREVFSSRLSVGSVHAGNYLVSLTKVTLPRQAPPDAPHHRSGAALHVVLSGVGAETADGATAIKSPGSVSFEPASLVYQWSNPGNFPLTYLVFNVSGETEAPVVAIESALPR